MFPGIEFDIPISLLHQLNITDYGDIPKVLHVFNIFKKTELSTCNCVYYLSPDSYKDLDWWGKKSNQTRIGTDIFKWMRK